MMRKFAVAMMLASGVLMAGCAGTAAVVQSEYRLAQGEKLKLQLNPLPAASEQGMAILQARLTTRLSSAALLADAGDVSSRTLEVTLTNYYMRHGAARATVGILAGADNVQSRAQVKDPVTGKVLSEFSVESKNPSAWGSSKGLLEEHADKIVDTLVRAKR
jgi:hypothetical protein